MSTSTFVKTELDGGVVVARLLCEKVAERESQVLQAELSAAATPYQWRLALDCEEVMLLASVGLGMLVTLNKNCKAGGGKMAVFNLSKELMEVLKLTRLERVLVIAKDRATAVKAVS